MDIDCVQLRCGAVLSALTAGQLPLRAGRAIHELAFLFLRSGLFLVGGTALLKPS